MMSSEEMYEELSSGKWLFALIERTGYAFREEAHAEMLANRASLHFQEMWAAYNTQRAQEESEQAAERVRVAESIEADPELADKYRQEGWVITRRARKSVDLTAFFEDHQDAIPQEALAVTKGKLPKELKKEFVKYESIEGYSYTAKRSQESE